ncbi:polyphosphate kinase 1 [Phaeocystidibacter luteus]|uniref:Polyphosphate kinase n=1 Tax=Phaeocystidibacter luteus TaxID=911197 RepID=A0A6N6RME6_9FLAO|nr:polyphosphate kinase 1 [Phaeocystidibacter luteus]KAB2814722.1 polyphosphate kinase 1 [Phaeocystidibacter luteus]
MSDVKRYVNRDLSWLRFNARVLQEAADTDVPLIERMRFLGIFSNNLDEFFRVRYASIKRMNTLKGKKVKEQLGGWSPQKLLKALTEEVIRQQEEATRIYDELILELEKENVVILNEQNLTHAQQRFVRKYYVEKVSPSVFILLLNDREEFPELRDKSIYLAIKLIRNADPDNPVYSLIEVPSELIGRFVLLPKYGKNYIMFLDDLIRFNLKYAFFIYPFDKIEAHTIKITRDAELDLDNDVSKSFLEKIEKGLKARKIGDPVRFVYDKELPRDYLTFFKENMELDSYDSLIPGGRYHNKKDLMKFPNVGRRDLEYPKVEPVYHPDLDMERSILQVVRQKDVLIFLPYHTFSYLIRFLREAAIDPQVENIKITLYRLADQSRVISALINAAKNGKNVTVVIELQARFDEEANIEWTEKLRADGVNVISGVPGLKVHSKVALVQRREGKKLVDYAIIGTGNYHEGTAKIYTDYHLMTADKRITKEIRNIFEFIRANYQVFKYEHLIVSPHYTRERFISYIDNEIANAKAGKPASMFLKMNSLSDYDMVEKLYEANNAGVKIRLIIRGICCLIPGIPGMSENIEAISVIDRFLEHSRVYIFENGGDTRCFIASADFMTRNLDHRLEVSTPIYSKSVLREIRDHMEILWKDNVKGRIHNAEQDNTYRKVPGPRIRSQTAMADYVAQQLRRGGRQ